MEKSVVTVGITNDTMMRAVCAIANAKLAESGLDIRKL
jgi:hypothetical protein